MIKKLLSYGAVEGIAKGLNKLLLLLLPLFIDTVSFGTVGLIISIETLLPILTFLGMERAVLRFFNQKVDYPGFLKSIWAPINFVHFVALGLIGVLGFWGDLTVFGLKLFPDLFLLIILVYLQGKNQILLNILRVNEDHKNYFIARITIQTLKFCLVLLLVYFTKNYLYYIIASIIASLVSNYLVQRKNYQKESNESFNRDTFRTLFLFSWPFIFHGLSLNFLGNADKFVIERYLSMSDVGLYTFAYSLGTSVTFAFVGVSIFIEPMIYKEDNEHKRNLILNKFLSLSMFIATFVYVLIALISDFILPHVYTNEYVSVFNFIPLVASAFIVFPFYLKSNYKLIYEKKTKSVAVSTVFTSILNIVLNILFIPKFGLIAGIVTTIFCYMLQALVFILIANRGLRNLDFTFWLILLIVQCILFGFNLNHYINFFIFLLYSICVYFFFIKFRKVKYE